MSVGKYPLNFGFRLASKRTQETWEFGKKLLPLIFILNPSSGPQLGEITTFDSANADNDVKYIREERLIEIVLMISSSLNSCTSY